MTTTTQGNTHLITTYDCPEILGRFLAGNTENKIGVECELTILKPHNDAHKPINQTENQQLRDILARPSDYGYNFTPVETSQEAGTLTLEIKTGAVTLDNIESILIDMDRQINTFEKVCEDLDYVIPDVAQPTDLKAKELFDYTVKRKDNRAEAFIEAFRRHGYPEYYQNFFLNNALQVSISPLTAEDLWLDAARFACLTAPIAVTHDNSGGYFEGKQDPTQTGLRLREGLSKSGRGGVPDFFFTAAGEEDFLRQYFDWVFDTPLIALCDEAGEHLHAIPKGQEKSFRQLIADDNGLNHWTNFELALGMVWPHIKLAFIKDDAGEITGTRYEVRTADMGQSQRNSLPLIAAASAMDPEFKRDIEWSLIRHGVAPDRGHESMTAYKKSIDAALHYRDEFGNGKLTSYLTDLGGLVFHCHAHNPALTERLGPFLDICGGAPTRAFSLRQEFLQAAHEDNPQAPLLFTKKSNDMAPRPL